MEFVTSFRSRSDEISTLFADTFSASEGEAEGALIGALSRDLIETTPDGDLFLFAAEDAGRLIGAVFMSRLVFPQDANTVFMLAPVAVETKHQGEGVGQTLIRHALEQMAAKGTDIAVTYGDPNYYGRFGFAPISTDDLAAPMPLQHPHGWLAQRLSGNSAISLVGSSECVPAFRDPAYW